MIMGLNTNGAFAYSLKLFLDWLKDYGIFGGIGVVLAGGFFRYLRGKRSGEGAYQSRIDHVRIKTGPNSTISLSSGMSHEEVDSLVQRFLEPLRLRSTDAQDDEKGWLRIENSKLKALHDAVATGLVSAGKGNAEAQSVLGDFAKGEFSSLTQFIEKHGATEIESELILEGSMSTTREEQIEALKYLGDFYAEAAILDELGKKTEISDDDLGRLLRIIGSDADLARYFYESNANPAWLIPLIEAGQFGRLGTDEFRVSDHEWAKAEYLVKVAGEKPAEVLKAIRLAAPRNQLIQGSLLEAILKMPPEFAEDAVDVITGYVRTTRKIQWYFVGKKTAEIMIAVASYDIEKAFEIAKPLLEFWKANDEPRTSAWEVECRLDEFHYATVLRKYFSQLADFDPLGASRVLVQILEGYLLSLHIEERNGFDYGLRLWLHNLDDAEIAHDNLIISLAAAICQAGKKLIENKEDKIDGLFKLFDSHRGVVFDRIQMHLLRFVPQGHQVDRINRFIRDLKYLEDNSYWYEYRLLLNDKYNEIDKKAKAVFEDCVKAQRFDVDEIEHFKEWFQRTNGIEATESDIAGYEKRRQARELYLVRDHYRELFEECLQVSGAKENEVEPRPRQTESFFGSPTQGSPKTVDELLDIEPEEVIRYLKSPSEWVVKKDPLITNTPEQALSGAFEEVVKKRPKDYIALNAKAIAGLRPIFIRDYYYALKEVVRTQELETSSFWPAILDISLQVTSAHGPSNSRDYSSCLLAVLGLVEEGLNKGPSEMPICDENLTKAYDIGEALLGYSFGSEMDPDPSMDPYTGSLNCVQGQAFRLILRLGIRAKNKLPELFDSFFTERIRKTLDWSIGEGKKPKIVSVLGSWFIHVYWLDEQWTKDNLDGVFDATDLTTWDTAWDSYIVWGRPSKQAFVFLAEHGKYGFALKQLLSKDTEQGQEKDRRLVEHLMIAFFNKWIEPDHGLLKQFWEEGPPSVKAHATEFLTTGFNSLKEDKDGKRKEEISAILLAFWKSRLEVIEQNPAAHRDEGSRFTNWIEDSPFDPGETLNLLDKTLTLTDGEVSPYAMYHEFVECVSELGEGNELTAIRCITKAVSQPKNDLIGYKVEEKFDNFLKHILSLSDSYPQVKEIRQEAIKMADAFGRRNLELEKFQGIYEKLKKRLTKP